MPDQPKDRTNQFLQEAYHLDSEQAMQDFYSNWADEYDQQLERELDYLAPTKTAAALMHAVADRAAAILDIGCGTGLTSVDLAAAGYATLDGLDFSAAMLRKARERGFYRTLIEADLNRPLDIADNTYDAALSSGTFTHGHVGAEPLDEIFRILKPGGYFICTIHNDVWHEHGFEDKLAALRADHTLKIVDMQRDAYFAGSAPDGMYYTLQKRSCGNDER